MVNEYLEAASMVSGGHTPQLDGRASLSIESTLDTNPDQEARVQKLAAETRLPLSTVRNNPQEAEKRQLSLSLKQMNLATKYPTLGRFLTDRERAAVARDDLDVLGFIEQDLKEAAKEHGSISAYYGPEPSASTILSGLGTSFRTGFGLMRSGIQSMVGDLTGDKQYANNALRKSAQLRSENEFATPAFTGSTTRGLYGGASSLLQTAPTLALGVATGSAPVAIGGAALQVQTQEYSKYRNRGATPTEALIGSGGEGLVEGATELLPMGFLVDRFGKGAAKEFIGGLLAREIPTEQVATVLQDAIDTAVANPDKTWGEYFAERPDAAYQTALATLVQSGAIGAVHLAAVRQDSSVTGASERDSAFIEKLHKSAEASKLRQRNAETFEQFVKEAAEDGPVTDVYIDGEVLNQSGIDTSVLSDETKAQIVAARETGGAVRIPVEEYAARLVGLEGSEALIDNLKLSPTGMSRAEAEVYMQEEGKALQSEMEKVLTKRATDSAFNQSKAQVEEKLFGELQSVGRFSDSVNRDYASLASTFYAAQADRLGITPQEMFDRYPLKVQSTLNDSFSFADFEQTTDLMEAFQEHGAIRMDANSGLIDARKMPTAEQFGVIKRVLEGSDTGGFVDLADGDRKLSFKADGDSRAAITKIRQFFNESRQLNQDLPLRAIKNEGDIEGVETGTPVSFNFVHNPDSATKRFGKPKKDAPYGRYYEPSGRYVTLVSEKGRNSAPDNMVTGELVLVNPLVVDNDNLKWKETLSRRYGGKRGKELSKAVIADGYDGVITKDGNYISEIVEFTSFDETKALYQGKTRGAFSPNTNTITLMKDADLSTFLHELGHFMLEMQVDIASQPDAPQQIKDDVDALLKWYEIEGDDQNARLAKWNSLTLEEKRDHHEKFARGFEAYLFEGKAPSPQLRSLFQRFRSWLVAVYTRLKNLNVTLTPEVRSVMDRLLATDQEIEQAEQLQRLQPLFEEAQAAGMTPEQFEEYQKLGVQATADAIEALDQRSSRDMQWLSNARSRRLKEMQKAVENKRRATRAEVTAEVQAEPVYRAQAYLKRGTIDGEPVGNDFHKLSIEEVQSLYGKDTPLYKSIVDKFKYGKYGMLARDNGVHPDQIAELFGFTSGDHLIKTLLDAEDMKQRIEGLTDQRMLERYGDLVDPRNIEAAVMESLKNDTRVRFVAAELSALEDAIGSKKLLAKAAKQYADELISRQLIRHVRPAQYEAAEAKASGKSQKAFRKGDIAEAATHKRNQLINMYASKSARKAIDDVEKGLRYLKKFDRKGKKGKLAIDQEYKDQIDALLERYDLKQITNKAVGQRQSLRNWIEQQKEAGIEPDIPDYLLDDATKKSYKELRVEEFRGLVDTVKQIEHTGRLKNKLLTAKEQRDFNVAKTEILTTLSKYAPKKKPDLRTRTNAGGTLKEMGLSYLAMHRKMASVLRQMDGFKEAGPLWEYIVRPMNEAGDKETVMREEATEKLANITEQLLEGGELLGGKGRYFESIGMSLNREERISIALNLGNASNQQRLLDGEGWTIDQLKPVLDTLTRKEWDFVQDVWDFFETYKPLTGAKQKRVFGKEPEWIEARPVNTEYGQYRGGYFPVKYDSKRSGRVQEFMDAEQAKQDMRAAYTSSTTSRSYTKQRADKVVGRPLLYSFSAIYQGTEEIIHDLTHHEWLIDVNKFIRDKDFDRAVRTNYGAEFASLIKDAVRDIARGNTPAQNVWERSVNHIRIGATIAGLGWNFSTAFLQPLGLTNSMVRIGPSWVIKGVNSWLKNPVDTVQEIYDKSNFMRLRYKTMRREINEIQNKLQQPGKIGVAAGKVLGARRAQATKEWVDWSMFLAIQKLQLVADVPTWLGAYEKAIADGQSDQRAVALADQAVVDSQGGGQVKDLSAIQRGGPLQKLWTNFYSYFNTVYNLNSEIKNRTDWKNPFEVAVAARDYLLLMVVPAVLGVLIKEALTGGDDDPEELVKKLGAEQVSYLLGTMVGLREVSTAAQRVAGVAQFNGSYGGPAGLRFLQEIDKLGTQVSQGEMDKALRKSSLNTAGVLFHLPSGQINKTWDGVEAIAEGEAGPAAVLVGPPR